MDPATRFRYDVGQNMVTITMDGPLSGPAIVAALDAALEAPDHRPGMARLWDFSDADPSALDAETLRHLSLHTQRFPPEIRDVRVAFVTSSDLAYGLARMFEAFSDCVAAPTPRIFHTLEEAQTWLSERPPT
jgi:hypothetical protein